MTSLLSLIFLSQDALGLLEVPQMHPKAQSNTLSAESPLVRCLTSFFSLDPSLTHP